jgi:diketogulonate reductase-like aldo/keto reductase
MEQRILGKTGEKIPALGMGTWKMGISSDVNETQKQLAALERGVELGMTMIDTAEVYSDGKSEMLVAKAIREKRDSIFLATKVWRDHLRRDQVVEACDRSLERLGVGTIDLYQVHWPNPGVPIRETMAAMEQLVRDGKVRYIGVSNFSARQVREARESLARSEVVSNQVEYSLTNQSIEKETLPFCEKEKVTVIAYSPLARGNIPGKEVPRGLLDKYHLTPAQAMLNWVTRGETVVAIPKASNVKHVEENAGSLDRRMSSEDYRALAQAFS